MLGLVLLSLVSLAVYASLFIADFGLNGASPLKVLTAPGTIGPL